VIDDQRRLLISVKPRFADAILDGSKTIELRRTAPRLELPTEALIYASTPVRALVGRCNVVDVIAYKPEGLWRLHRHAVAVTHDEFKAYFAGCSIAYGLILAEPKRFYASVDLGSLRMSYRGFQPPQSFRYLSIKRSDEFMAMAG
jgi:predicted transcriptional regulator